MMFCQWQACCEPNIAMLPESAGCLPSIVSTSMRFEVSFQSLFWKCKAFNLKKLKLSLSPSPQWPQAACGWGATAGKFLRQTKGRTVFGLGSFESINPIPKLIQNVNLSEK